MAPPNPGKSPGTFFPCLPKLAPNRDRIRTLHRSPLPQEEHLGGVDGGRGGPDPGLRQAAGHGHCPRLQLRPQDLKGSGAQPHQPGPRPRPTAAAGIVQLPLGSEGWGGAAVSWALVSSFLFLCPPRGPPARSPLHEEYFLSVLLGGGGRGSVSNVFQPAVFRPPELYLLGGKKGPGRPPPVMDRGKILKDSNAPV